MGKEIYHYTQLLPHPHYRNREQCCYLRTVSLARPGRALAGRPLPHLGRSAGGYGQQNVLAPAQLPGMTAQFRTILFAGRVHGTSNASLFQNEVYPT